MKLDETVAEMRRLGVTRYKTADLEIDLGPAPPLAPEPKKEEETDVSEETKAEREWVALFKRATRASGAPIPPFPKRGPKIVGQP